MYNNQIPPCMMWGQMPMGNMQGNAQDMDDRDLEMMYPKIYFKIIPMVKVHCDKMESKYGMFFCPSKDEMHEMIQDIYKKIDKDIDDEKDKKGKKGKCREEICEGDLEDSTRQKRRYGRRSILEDLIGIVILNELFGRRRRMPHYGYYGSY